MNALKTPSGIHYLEDFKGNHLPSVIYLSGYGQFSSDINVLKNVAFFTKFCTDNKDKYNFFIPLHPKNSYSWVYPFFPNGNAFAVEFNRYIIGQYKTGKPILAGHSAGGPWPIAFRMLNELAGICVVSSSGDYKEVIEVGKTKIPVIVYHGEKDNTAPNTYVNGVKAIGWYEAASGLEAEFHSLPNVGHGADVQAFAKGYGLKEWIDKVPEVKPGLYLDNVWMHETEFEFENHKVKYIP